MCDRGEDLSRARFFGVRTRWVADENLPATRRVAQRCRIVGAADANTLDPRFGEFPSSTCVRWSAEYAFRQRAVHGKKRDGNIVRSGFGRKPHFQARIRATAFVGVLRGVGLVVDVHTEDALLGGAKLLATN